MSDLQKPQYSESDVIMFLGFLSGDISELHQTHPDKLHKSWDLFLKRAAGHLAKDRITPPPPAAHSLMDRASGPLWERFKRWSSYVCSPGNGNGHMVEWYWQIFQAGAEAEKLNATLRTQPAATPGEPDMAMLPNGYHPGVGCSCRECLRAYPTKPAATPKDQWQAVTPAEFMTCGDCGARVQVLSVTSDGDMRFAEHDCSPLTKITGLNFEPCYCKRCDGKLPAPCRYGTGKETKA